MKSMLLKIPKKQLIKRLPYAYLTLTIRLPYAYLKPNTVLLKLLALFMLKMLFYLP